MRSPSRRRPPFVVSAWAATVAITTMVGTARAQQAAPPADEAEACFAAAERAQPLLRQKKLREARALLDVCSRDSCPRAARTDCREWLAEATDAQPSIVIAAHEIRGTGAARETRDLNGVRAVIDDVLVIDRVDTTPIVIDPGRHRLRLERAGADPLVQDVDIREGEKGRVVDAYWHVASVAIPARPIPPSVLVVGGIGVFAVGVGTYFEISGLVQRHDLDVSCKPTASCLQSKVDSTRTQMRIGDVTLGGGLLFLAGSMILYFTRPAADTPEAPSPRTSASATPWFGPVPGGGFLAGTRGTL